MIKTLMFVLALSWVWCADSHAYVHISTDSGVPVSWKPAEVTLNILVGCPDLNLPPPMSSCFSRATAVAAAAWNATEASFTFQVRTPTTGIPVACSEGDPTNTNGLVTVFWASDQNCSPPITRDFLAVTHMWWFEDGQMSDADIQFNDIHYDWAVHDVGFHGPLTFDFARVALHELGHVLGLDHPNDHGQTVRAIMNSGGHTHVLQPDDIAGVRATYPPQVAVTKGALENPGPDASKTGIGFVSGWVCDANRIEVAVGNRRFAAAYGTERGDTRSICGDADNGFVLLVNWNLFGTGTHRVRLLADGHELANRSVTVTTFGTEWLAGRDGDWWTITDWPTAGTEITIRWTESLQNIEIVDIRQQDLEPVDSQVVAQLRRLLGTWRFTYFEGSAKSDVLTFTDVGSDEQWTVAAFGTTALQEPVWAGVYKVAFPDTNYPQTYVVQWQTTRSPPLRCRWMAFDLLTDTTAVGLTSTAIVDADGECTGWTTDAPLSGTRQGSQ